MSFENGRPKTSLREFAVAIGAVAICVIALVIGTWVFLRFSGAGDELRAVQEAASDPGGSSNAVRRFWRSRNDHGSVVFASDARGARGLGGHNWSLGRHDAQAPT